MKKHLWWLVALPLAACMGADGQPGPMTTAAVEPAATAAVAAPAPATPRKTAETVCPLIAFTVEGRPADDEGFATTEAQAVLIQRLREEGFEAVSLPEAQGSFQSGLIDLEAPLYDGTEVVRGSNPEVQRQRTENLRFAYTKFRDSLRDDEKRQLAVCRRIMFGRVTVDEVVRDAQTAGQRAGFAVMLMGEDAFTGSGGLSGYKAGEVIEAGRRQAVRSAMQEGIEAVVLTIGEAPSFEGGDLYTVDVTGARGSREIRPFVSALETQGCPLQDSIETRFTCRFAGSSAEFETALNTALDGLQGRYPGLDYVRRASGVTVCLQGC